MTIPVIDLRRLRLVLEQSSPELLSETARQRTLDRIKVFEDAQAELERVCKEQGIEVPKMVMGTPRQPPVLPKRPGVLTIRDERIV